MLSNERNVDTRLLIVATCIVFSTVTHAQQPSSIRYLMGESVSLFEWGMFRLQTRAERFAWDDVDVQNQFAKVDYDWDRNQIVLRMTVYLRYTSLQAVTPRGACGSLIRQMKFHFGVTPGAEFMRDLDGVATFFRPQYFEKKNAPDTLTRDLEAAVQLRVDVMASRADRAPFENVQSCSSDLVKSEVLYFTTSTR